MPRFIKFEYVDWSSKFYVEFKLKFTPISYEKVLRMKNSRNIRLM